MASAQWAGLRQIEREFKSFSFIGPQVKRRYLKLIGEQAVQFIRLNTPRDSGELAASWRIVGEGPDFIDVGTDLISLVEILGRGVGAHLIVPKTGNILRFTVGGEEIFVTFVQHPGFLRNDFVARVSEQINSIIFSTLEGAWANRHTYFRNVKTPRKFQQVGRTSAGFGRGISFAGRSTLVRAGTGRRQLKRRLALRRRRGSSILKKTAKME